MNGSSTTLGRVRIRANAADLLATQMRSEAVLRAVDLAPPGVPSQAILCIRSLADPMPGGIDARSPHAARAGAWERAARSAISAAYGRAFRPAHGMVLATADAVVFADRAELLACAARDASSGQLYAWWWANLLRAASIDAVIETWVAAPSYVPAALELLAQPPGRSADLVTFVRSIPPPQAVALLARVLAVHGLDELARAIVAALQPRRGFARAAPVAPAVDPPPPFEAVAPEIPPHASIAVEQRLFASVALALRRAPTTVGTRSFARRTVAWVEVVARVAPPQTSAEKPAPQESLRTAAPAARAAPSESPEVIAGAAPQSVRSPAAAGSPPHRQPAEEARSASAHTQRAHTVSPDAPRLPSARGGASPESPEDRRAESRHRATASIEEPPAEVATQGELADGQELIAPCLDSAPRRLNTAIASDCAGVFFLLNVAFALEIYDRYTAEGPALEVWDFLALTGRALVPAIEQDPVWGLLAALANRADDDTPGAGFVPPNGQSFDEWLQDVISRVREILGELFEIDDPAWFLIRRSGRIEVTPAHVDLYFALPAHPVEIRMSGLDRDPGWIPAAGRHVAFHFE